LSEAAHDSQALYLYRRIHPDQWSKKGRPGRSAFLAEEGKGLSLFRTDMQSPRGVLQHAIDAAKAKLKSDDAAVRENGAKQLQKYGQTVDEWLERGWRVVRVPLHEFESRGYTFDDPADDGHVNAFGDYATHAIDLSQKVVEVPLEDFQG
jgi:hypothetical protein